MATEPFKQLFDPDLSKESAKPRIAAALSAIEEIRNYGQWLFARSSIRPAGGDEEVAILLLYYHLLEMLDAVGILIAESAPVPARLQLRAMFEALLSIEYMIRSDMVRRAHAYLVADIIERLEFYDSSILLQTQVGRSRAPLHPILTVPTCRLALSILPHPRS